MTLLLPIGVQIREVPLYMYAYIQNTHSLSLAHTHRPALGETGELGERGLPPLPPFDLKDLGRVLKKDGRSEPLASQRWVLSLTETFSLGHCEGLGQFL